MYQTIALLELLSRIMIMEVFRVLVACGGVETSGVGIGVGAQGWVGGLLVSVGVAGSEPVCLTATVSGCRKPKITLHTPKGEHLPSADFPRADQRACGSSLPTPPPNHSKRECSLRCGDVLSDCPHRFVRKQMGVSKPSIGHYPPKPLFPAGCGGRGWRGR